MRYALACFLDETVGQYHKSLVNAIAAEFGLALTKAENLPTHFTLKYWFESKQIEVIDHITENFCKTHQKTQVKVGGCGGFRPKVVFLDVALSKAAKRVFLEFVSELRKVQWVTWDKYEAENLHFHATLAEECNEKYDAIRKFMEGNEKHFECWFDNISIVREVSRERGILEWEVHKKHSM